MTQLGVGSFVQQQQTFSATPHEPQQLNEKERQKSEESQKTSTMTAALGDILLNTFQIKKKRYRVLLNYDHIVWEAYNRKQQQKEQQKQLQVEQQRHLEAGNDKQGGKKADSEPESEQLAQSSSSARSYGSHSHIVHIDELIRVAKGSTKAAVARPSSSQNNNASPAAPASENTSVPTDQYLCLHYVERVVKSSTDCNRWHVRQLTLYNSDPYIVRQWHTAISKMLHNASRLRVQRLLVFINPYGGRQQGLQVYERHCKPLFQLANIDASCIISQRANQIRDILMSNDLKQYDAVCCVGGDGTAAEVINGLIFRSMQDLGLDMLQPEFIPKPCLPIGIIPAGSTDTIAYSVHGTSDVRTAAIHLILGQRRGLDVCSVRNREGLVRFCASVLSYGYLGDVAAKSEKYRWMGTKRYEYTGVKAFLSNRGYEAELRLLESPLADEEPQPSTSSSTLNQQSPGGNPLDSKCYVNCQRCSTANSLQTLTSSWLSKSAEALGSIDPDSEPKASENVEAFHSNQDCDSEEKRVEVVEKTPTSSVAADEDEESENSEQWKVIKGRFFMISGANITCACSRSPNGISRFSHLGDGFLDLILVRKTSILNNLKFLLNTVGRNGDIRNLPFVEVYRTRKFTFRTLGSSSVDCGDRGSCQPIADLSEDTEYSSWNCDGEVVCDLEITMSSHCQLIDVFMRGPYPHSKLTAGKLEEQSSLMNCCCAK